MEGSGDSTVLRWANRRAVRLSVTGLVGLSLFLLGARYLSLRKPPEVIALLVAGSEEVRAGASTALRVSANRSRSREQVPVAIDDVLVDDEPVEAEIDGDAPAIVRYPVPDDAGDAIEVTLRLSTSARSKVSITQEVRRLHDTEVRLGEAEGGSASEAGAPLRLDVLPEAGALAGGMRNRVFIRVLERDGTPAGGARVRIGHAVLQDGELVRTTGPSGLVAFELTGDRPSFSLDLAVEHDGESLQTEKLLRPIGRQLMLRLDPPVVAPGEPARPVLRSWQPRTAAYCDLLDHEAWRDSFRVRTTEERERRLELEPLPPGPYRLQCYRHPLVPGSSWATLPLVVSEDPPLDALLEEARERGARPEPALVAPKGTDRALAASYWQAVLREPPTRPTVLLSTRGRDLARESAAHERKRNRLLLAMGGVMLLVFLWMGETLLRHIIRTRDRMRRQAIEAVREGADIDVDALGGMDPEQRAALLRTRGILFLVVVVGTLVLNALGLLGVLALIR